MTLKEWCARYDAALPDKRKGAVSALMRATGLSYTTVLHARDGKTTPSDETIERFRVATDGDVTAADFGVPGSQRPPASRVETVDVA